MIGKGHSEYQALNIIDNPEGIFLLTGTEHHR